MTEKLLKIEKVERFMKKIFPDASNWTVKWKYDDKKHEDGQYRMVRSVNGSVTQSGGKSPFTEKSDDEFRKDVLGHK